MASVIQPGEVHLWYAVCDDASDAENLEDARRMLTSEEWARADRFTAPQGRREYIATRCMIRTRLSRYADVEPADWRFAAGPFGRPEIVSPLHAVSLRFNLSHSGGMVACVVSGHHDVGVDVESLARRPPIALADSHFAPSERTALLALPEHEQPRRFLEYWTLKEAYVKARGGGLSLPLDQFAFDLGRGERPRVTFRPGAGNDEADWQFDQLLLGAHHLAAVATRRGAATVAIVVRPAKP